MRIPALILLVIFAFPVAAQSLSGSVGLFVYPAKDQSKQQQEQDDYQCYAWARDESNFDPMTTRSQTELQS